MSVVFSDDFDSGSLTGWGSPNELSTVTLWGNAGTTCTGCYTGQSRKTLGAPVSGQGAVRAQVAAILTDTDPTDGALLFSIVDTAAGGLRWNLVVYLRPDGAFRIRYNSLLGGGGVAFQNTAGGVFPTDGTQFGLQVRFTIAATNYVTFTVNNSDVGTLTFAETYAANQWDDLWLYNVREGGTAPLTQITLVDDYEADDDDAAVDWPAGTAPQLDVNRTCFLAPSSLNPVPNPTPAAAKTPCTPESEVTNGGIGHFGCNPGGIGWTSLYPSGPYDTVPQHDDPVDGESLSGKRGIDVWIEINLPDASSSPASTVQYRRSFRPLGHLDTYEGGYKSDGLKAVGDVEHSLGNEMHAFETATVTADYADQVDRLVRTDLDTRSWRNGELLVKGASPAAVAANDPPRIFARSVIKQADLSSPMNASIQAVDQISTLFATRKYPHWQYKDCGDSMPFAPKDTLELPIIPLYGEKSDHGGTDPVTDAPASKGDIPGIFCGRFDLTSFGMEAPPDAPGYTMEALVAALQASVDANTTDADWGGCIGHLDSAVLEGMGTVPSDYTHLASIIGYADLDAALAGECGGTTPAPDDTAWGFIAFGLAEWFAIPEVFGSDLGSGDATAERSRMLLDCATRSDILHPDFTWPFPNRYVEFTNSETGRTFWIMGVFVRGQLLDDHINGVINITCNAIGIMGNAGLPLIDAHACEQHWHENFVQNDWSSGPWTDETNFPQWGDGTPKVNTRTFAECQSLSATLMGGSPLTRGLTVGWFPKESKTIKACIDDWDRDTCSKTGLNGHWQIIKFRFNPDMDTSGFVRVDHPVHVFGKVTSTPGLDPKTVAVGSCDWDPDASKFRAGPITRKNDEGLTYNGNEELPTDPMESVILNDPAQLTWVLDQHLLLLRFGTTFLDVSRDIGAWDTDVGQGVFFTTIEGTGATGYVDRKCIKLRRKFSFASRIVTDTYWDVERLIAGVVEDSGPAAVSLQAGALALRGQYIGIAFQQPPAGALVFTGYAPTPTS